jgi:hypothetical protein
MPILKLTPSCKDYLWGGSRLRTDFGIQCDLDPLAEAWVLSCHPDGPSYLPDGTTLAAYIAAHPGCLGTDCDRFEQFPILTKFIDAKQNLSVQVHPSNEYALEKEHQYGKTEMWYVLDCVPGAYLYYGFTHEISKEEFAERIKNNTLTEVLNAPFIVAKTVIPDMIEQGGGKIINICSMMSELGRETVSAYAAAKGGLKMLTKNIASEYGKYNIQCNGIGPGYIATPQTAPLREIQPDGSRHPFDQFIVAKTPAERWGEAEDLGGPAVFLASEASDFVNGLILYVDGGILAYIGKQPG